LHPAADRLLRRQRQEPASMEDPAAPGLLAAAQRGRAPPGRSCACPPPRPPTAPPPPAATPSPLSPWPSAGRSARRLIAASRLRRIAPLAGADQPPVALLGVADGVPLEIGIAVARLTREASALL